MDRITKRLLEEFVSENELKEHPEDKAFEMFCGFLATSRHYQDAFSPESIAVGAGADCGIDCIAIIANGSLVFDPEEIDSFCDVNGYLDVTLVFVQAERSSNFETQKIGQFGFGVNDFLSEHPKLQQNEELASSGRIIKRIFEQSKYFKKGNPQCCLYYMTTGRWQDDQNLNVRRESERAGIDDSGIFRSVSFECLGASELQKMYQESQNAIATEVVFSKRVVIPEIVGVEEAYLGVLPATEFLKLIQGDAGEVLRSIFYDNVRHWQEWNPVNSEMRATLDNPDLQKLFPLLNNGVTIVAKRVSPTGDKFLVEDYQVVNGCQTSHVLHSQRERLNETVFVPVRLIATTNEDVRNAIIKATNRQTEVTDEQLFSLADFPKKLEEYFISFPQEHRLYYERRSRQYAGVPGVEKVRIITMTALIRAYAAMFREVPHRTTRDYGSLLKEVGREIFGKEHKVEPYYTAALAHYKLDYMFRNNHLAPMFKPARHHMLMAFRYLCSTERPPRAGSNDMARYATELNQLLWDEEGTRAKLYTAAEQIYQAAERNMHRDNIRTESFTQKLKRHLTDSLGSTE